MSEHTPGPWKVSHDKTVVANIEGRERLVASCHVYWGHSANCKQDAANAALIAAAPDMLAALEEGIALIDQLAQTRRHWSARQQGIFEHMERARNLARGGV